MASSVPLKTDGHAITQVIDCPGLQLLRYQRDFSDEEHERFLADATRDMEQVRSTARFVMIIDINKAGRGSAVQRDRQAKWQEQHTGYFKKHVIAGVFVAESTVLRGALRAVSWVKPFPYPIHIDADIESAITKALAVLQADGQPLPTPTQLRLLKDVYA